MSEQDKDQVNKGSIVGAIVEDLQSGTYSKYDLIKVIEYALVSYVDRLEENHVCEEMKPTNCPVEVREALGSEMGLYDW